MSSYSRNAAISFDLGISNQSDADTNFKGDATIALTTASKFSSAKRAILRFRRPSRLRSGDTIDAASLTLNFTSAAGLNTIPLTFAPLLRSERVTDDATWNDADGVVAWGSAGGDFESSVLGINEHNAPTGVGDASFDIAEAVASAIAHNPNSEYIDILVKQSNEASSFTLVINAYEDSGGEPDAEAPRLSITFTNNTTVRGGGGSYLSPGSVSADPGLRSLPFGGRRL